MTRSVKKGPFVVESLVRKVEGMNRKGEGSISGTSMVPGESRKTTSLSWEITGIEATIVASGVL